MVFLFLSFPVLAEYLTRVQVRKIPSLKCPLFKDLDQKVIVKDKEMRSRIMRLLINIFALIPLEHVVPVMSIIPMDLTT